MANYTPAEFQKKINDKIRSLDIVNKVVFPVATQMSRLFTERVFDKGIGGDNSQIGIYSTKPLYASKKAFRNAGSFKGQGKNAVKSENGKLAKGSKKKKDGSLRKSMYLTGGYKELKSIQGLESSFVNLTYRGDLRRGLKLATEKDIVILKVAGLNEKKVDGLTDKYGADTFKHTKEEKEFFKKEIQRKLIEYLTK